MFNRKPERAINPTISKEYRELLTEKHDGDEKWGTSAKKYAEPVLKLMKDHGLKTLLDYGCGKGELAKALFSGIPVRDPEAFGLTEYDPAIPGKDNYPSTGDFDLIACIDVLEHVEPDMLDNTLENLKDMISKLGYFIISTRKASHILPDGRNAHLIVEKPTWWKKKFAKHFEKFDSSYNSTREELTVIVSADDYKADIKAPEALTMIKPKGLWM